MVAEIWLDQPTGRNNLGLSAGFSQISDAIKAGRLRESLSFLGGIRKIGR
jgi:hypothetical protein